MIFIKATFFNKEKDLQYFLVKVLKIVLTNINCLFVVIYSLENIIIKNKSLTYFNKSKSKKIDLHLIRFVSKEFSSKNKVPYSIKILQITITILKNQIITVNLYSHQIIRNYITKIDGLFFKFMIIDSEPTKNRPPFPF